MKRRVPTVFVQWDGTATLLNGDPYFQHAIHVITLQWGKIHPLDVFEDSQAVARRLTPKQPRAWKKLSPLRS